MTITPSAPTTAGRFNIVQNATALPGACLFCAGSRGPFIDTQRYMRGHGTVLICVGCLTEMAGVANLTGKSDPAPDISLTPAELEEVVSGYTNDLVTAASDLISYLTGAGFVTLLTESERHSGVGDGDEEGPVGSSEQVDGAVSSEGPNGLSGDSGDGFSADDEDPFS